MTTVFDVSTQGPNKSRKADSPTPVLSTGMAMATSSGQLSYEKMTGYLGEGKSYAQMTGWRLSQCSYIRLNVLCTLSEVLFRMELIP